MSAKEDAEGGAQAAILLKDEGNAKFKAGEYQAAIDAYTRSLELDSSQHLCFSNRSAAYLKLGNRAEEALRDAEECVRLAPSWAKGYSRQAAALQALKRWDEALTACQSGPEDDALRKMAEEVRCRKFHESLKGTWHGTVSEVLGGYDQEMEFLDDSRVRVEVLGRSIVGRYWLETSPEPFHLNIQVPMQDVPQAPMMPPPPPVPYIARMDDKGLHLCCPYMKLERPTDFSGPGYCLMVTGPMSSSDNSEVATLSKKEKLLLCARELLDALPNRKLEEVSQTDSEEETRDKLMAQVRFETSMFGVQKKFGEDTLKEVLGATKSAAEVPAELFDTQELKALQEKLKKCGILEEESSSGGPNPSSPTKPPPKRGEQAKEEKAPSDKPAPAASSNGVSSQVAGLVTLGAVAAIVVAFVAWRRQRR